MPRLPIILALMLPLLAACLPGEDTYIILWHSWEESEATVLNQAIDRFERVFSDVQVITSYVPESDLRTRYQEGAAQGLGPDIVIGSDQWVTVLASEKLIHPLEVNRVDTSIYFPTAVTALTYEGELYGLPLEMHPMVLFYNQQLVDSPPQTLNELRQQATEDQAFGLNGEFERIIWGVQAFGGRILDDNGRVVLDEGSLANWLTWLLQAEDEANIVITRDEATLFNLFVDGRITYYATDASQLTALQAAMGTDAVGVVPLPDGPAGASGPFLWLDALLLNQASSPAQHEAALTLATFLTNIEQSTIFMRELGHVSANRRVRVDARAYPAIAGVVEQSRTAIPLPSVPQMDMLLQVGDDAMLRVLEGILDPNTAAIDMTTTVNQAYDFGTIETAQNCSAAGELRLWHNWTTEAATWLQSTIEAYQRQCDDVAVNLTYIPNTELLAAYLEADRAAPDLLIGDGSWLIPLVEAGMIASIPREQLQPFLPVTQQAMRYQDLVYGIPLTLATQLLYFNRDLITDPAVTLADLQNQITAGTSIALQPDVSQTVWGWTASGGLTTDATNTLTLNNDGAVAWLTWLTAVNAAPQGDVSKSLLLLNNRFIAGESAYYVANSSMLAPLAESLGDALDISPLPAGNGGPARPRLQMQVLYHKAGADDAQRALMADLTTYLTSADQQRALIETTRWLSANTNTTAFMNSDPLLAEALTQARTAVAIPQTEANEALIENLNRIVNQLLAGQITPEAAMDSLR